jgi:hypothetical protein
MDDKYHRLAFTISALAAVIISFTFYGCLTGSEIPNEITGTLVGPDGQVQSGAVVSLFPFDLIPGEDSSSDVTAAVETDAQGHYRFQDIPTGTYNLLAKKADTRAFKDSIVYDTRSYKAGVDTLMVFGALTGIIRLQKWDSPRKALVQVIGTDLYVNVDSSSRFTLTDMPAGKYRIRIFIMDGEYVPEFRVITIRSGVTDTFPEIISPYYTGEPQMVTGLKSQALPDGSIRLTWDRIDYKEPITYAIFREPMDAPYGNGNAMIYSYSDTVFIDTIYSYSPKEDLLGWEREDWPNTPFGGQWLYNDTTAYRFQYKVWTTNTNSQLLGSPSIFTKVTAIPPTLQAY